MKRGFTLIEILTAIAILAVLVGILFPVFSRARDSGRQATCLSNLGQIGRAIGLYMADYDDVFPYAVDPSDRDRPEIWSRYPEFQAQIPFMPYLHDAIFPYVKSREVFHCPSDSGTKVLDSNFGIPFDTQGPMFAKYGTSYFFRTEIAFRYYTQDRFELPSQTNVLFDGAGHWHGDGKPMEIEDTFDALKNLRRGYRYNVLYGDFHAKSVTADLLDQAWQTRL